MNDKLADISDFMVLRFLLICSRVYDFETRGSCVFIQYFHGHADDNIQNTSPTLNLYEHIDHVRGVIQCRPLLNRYREFVNTFITHTCTLYKYIHSFTQTARKLRAFRQSYSPTSSKPLRYVLV